MGWDDIEKVLHHSFYNELRIAPEETVTVLPLPPQTTREVRRKYCEMLFETFNVPATYLAHASVLSLLASGSSNLTGLSVISGQRCTYITPVYCGHALDYLTQKVPIGGQDVTATLVNLLTATGLSFTTTSELAIVNHIKERCCLVELDPASATTEEVDYDLPDGQTIKLGKPRSAAPEIMFQPQLFDPALDPTEALHHKIVSVIESCQPFMRSALYANIVLSGGNTLFGGFVERLEKELKGLLDQRQQAFKLVAPPERQNLVWIGASILGHASYFQHMCITKDEYDEIGPDMVNRKCF